jgi:hypothetical protein
MIWSKFTTGERETLMMLDPTACAMPPIYFQVGLFRQVSGEDSVEVTLHFQLPGGGSGSGNFYFDAVVGK